MQCLPFPGILMPGAGLAGLAYCVVEGVRIRRAGLPPDEIHRRLHKLLAVNLGSVGLAALGLAMLVAGLLL